MGAFFLRENYAKPTRKTRKDKIAKAQRKSRKKLFAFKGSACTFSKCIWWILNAPAFFVIFAEFSCLSTFRVFRGIFVCFSRRKNAHTESGNYSKKNKTGKHPLP